MYRRPKFLEALLEIRRQMALEADYDVDLFAENARSGTGSTPSAGKAADADGPAEKPEKARVSDLIQTREG